MIIRLNFILLALLFSCSQICGVSAADKVRFGSYNGLAMTGYQGWFNTPDDGAGLGWKHYAKNSKFAPGSCSIDMWPDVSEYEKVYPTAFKHQDGSTAYIFSSHDASTVDLHFKWMAEYGIDGAFVQRFVQSLKGEKQQRNSNEILKNALSSAMKHHRAICVMYDLSGMSAGDEDILIEDWKNLQSQMRLTSQKDNHYLHHNSKPLVAIWGIGFNDNRKYGYDNIKKIIDFFVAQGCSIMVGVPAYWRTLSMDTMPDGKLHEIIMQADIIHPWFVGRCNLQSYGNVERIIKGDVEWCARNKKDYAPVLFPGFSWFNLQSGVAAPTDAIPRLGGEFLWRQVYGAISAGAKSLYLAMFDEIDEGTALFKCTNNPPVGESPFVTYKEVEPDHYMWLSGQAAKALRGETELSKTMPKRK